MTIVHEPQRETSDDAPAHELSETILAERAFFQIPSQPDWIEPTVEHLKERALLSGACHEDRIGKLVIALHEALTNSIVHGNLEIPSNLKEQSNDSFARLLVQRSNDPDYGSRFVSIEIDYDGDRCCWTLTDQGKGFEFDRFLSKVTPSPEDLFLSSGRGILLMRAFLDDVRYEAGGTRVVLTMLRSSGSERREHRRFSYNHRVKVAPVDDDGRVDWNAAYAAVAQNCSETGIGLVQSGLAKSDRVIIGVEADNRVLYVPARIRHCRTIDDRLVELGCEFEAATTYDRNGEPTEPIEAAVASLLDQVRHEPSAPHEQRAHPREAYNAPVEVHDPGGLPPVRAIARNLSKGGIAFISPQAIPHEERILFLDRDDDSPLRLRAKIVRCTKLHQGFYDVGARFLSLAPHCDD